MFYDTHITLSLPNNALTISPLLGDTWLYSRTVNILWQELCWVFGGRIVIKQKLEICENISQVSNQIIGAKPCTKILSDGLYSGLLGWVGAALVCRVTTDAKACIWQYWSVENSIGVLGRVLYLNSNHLTMSTQIPLRAGVKVNPEGLWGPWIPHSRLGFRVKSICQWSTKKKLLKVTENGNKKGTDNTIWEFCIVKIILSIMKSQEWQEVEISFLMSCVTS